MTQTFKVALGGRLLDQVLAAAGDDEVVTSEAIRRILWLHFESHRASPKQGSEASILPEALPAEEPGPDPAPIRPQVGPGSAPTVERPRRRSASLPIPLPSPQGRGLTEETKAEAKALSSGESLTSRCSGRACEEPAHARPGEPGEPCQSRQRLAAPALTPGPSPETGEGRTAKSIAPALWLPCRASRRGDPSAWGLSQDQVDRWQAVFSGLDVLAEARKAAAWLEANPGRWKTCRGMARFLFSWLERANDGGRFGRREARGGGGWNPAGDRRAPPPPPPPKGSLREAYGRDSFEEWEAELRAGISDSAELEKCLRDLAKLRAEWQAKHAA